MTKKLYSQQKIKYITVAAAATTSWGEGGAASRTANKRLTKLYWSSRKRSLKRLPLEPKSGGARQKISGALPRTCAQ